MSRDEIYLRHILDAGERVLVHASVGRERFMSESHWQDAVMRRLEVMGEAVKRLSAEVWEANPDVPWKRIAGMRDMLIHEYMGVDLDAVWEVAAGRVPEVCTS